MAKPTRGLPPDQRQSKGRAPRGIMQNAVDLPRVQSGADVFRPSRDGPGGIGFDDLDPPPRRAQVLLESGPALVAGEIKRGLCRVPIRKTFASASASGAACSTEKPAARAALAVFSPTQASGKARSSAVSGTPAKAWALVASTRSKPPCGKGAPVGAISSTGATMGKWPRARSFCAVCSA